MENKQEKLEAWLRGPLENITGTLQPAAHAMLQALEELEHTMHHFPDAKLWEKPAGVASVGFHLQHITGVLDRLLTYARNESLSESQLAYLKAEGEPYPGCTTAALTARLAEQVQTAIRQIENTPETDLLLVRYVGRNRVPSTTLGLLFHAAEHTQRHTGQLLVTARILTYEHE